MTITFIMKPADQILVFTRSIKEFCTLKLVVEEIIDRFYIISYSAKEWAFRNMIF